MKSVVEENNFYTQKKKPKRVILRDEKNYYFLCEIEKKNGNFRRPCHCLFNLIH